MRSDQGTTPTQRTFHGMKRFPWIYVPTTYFAEGVPYMVVNTVSVIIYKTMGIPNRLIGLTSALSIPWIIKMFWAPLVDGYSTKRRWIIAMQLALAAAFIFLALAVNTGYFFVVSLMLLGAIAFASATHDIATDGFYMLSLSPEEQALYTGVRSTCYRLAMIFTSGVLVVIAGMIQARSGGASLGWTVVLCIAAAIFFGLALFHAFYLPYPPTDRGKNPAGGGAVSTFLPAFRSYFTQTGIVPIVAFILLYRFGEALLVKMAQPFLLDVSGMGGLGLSTETVGFVYGTVGTSCLLAGGILGGWLISRCGLRRCLWPMAIALNAPDLCYVYLAWAKPALGYVYAMVAAEQFGYGVGFSAFTVFLIYRAKHPYKTSHYAISTGLMALGLTLPAMASGYLQEYLGYYRFFILVCLLTIPGMITIWFIPKEEGDGLSE